MKTDIKKDTAKIVYSGERFKKFLQRNKISYKEAAEALGIDKNTVGKAVRGGNLNLDIILRICNVYPMRIADFFLLADENGETLDTNYFISLNDNVDGESRVSEEEFCYKRCENLSERIKEISDMMETSHSKLIDLSREYHDCCRLLDSLITHREGTHQEPNACSHGAIHPKEE